MRLPFVLAANLETLIGVAFVVISLISGLTNYLNSRAKPNAPNRGGQRPVRPRSERIQSEIEQFMREQVRRQEGDAPPAAARPQSEPPRASPPKKPLPQRRPSTPKGPSPRPPAKKPAEPLQRQPIGQSGPSPLATRPGEDISHRKSIASGGLGQGLRDHLKSAMIERVQSESQTHLGSGVAAEVTRHLGTFASVRPAAPVIAELASATLLASDLRSREGMRRAVIAQIALERPKSLRRDSRRSS